MNQITMEVLCVQCGDEFTTEAKLVSAGREGQMREMPLDRMCPDCSKELSGDLSDEDAEGEDVVDD